jgi:hypothetical protein
MKRNYKEEQASLTYVACYIHLDRMSYVTKVLASGENRDTCKLGVGGGATREALAVSLMTQLRLKMIKHCRGLQHRQIYRIRRDEVALILTVPPLCMSSPQQPFH